jgi:hypothetical protein
VEEVPKEELMELVALQFEPWMVKEISMGMGQVLSTFFKLALLIAGIGLLPLSTRWLSGAALENALSHPTSGFISY